MKGLIIKTTGSAYHVLLDNGQHVEAYVKGNFRIQGIRSTNPVAVGDNVEITQQKDGTNWITAIEDRTNFIVRKSTNLSKQSHILAANIDQVVLLVTVNHPKTATTFIDRFLATCEAYRVPVILLFNKVDLYSEDDLAELTYLRALYGHLGYDTYAISAKEFAGKATDRKKEMAQEGQTVSLRASIGDLVQIFEGKTTLLSGNSGVGKSTLLNALLGEERAKTAEISDAHNQGKHTTTFSEMYFLPAIGAPEHVSNMGHHGAVIDTPGIRGFGTFDFEKEEVGHYFREIFEVSRSCRFSNCTHCGEPGCAVLPAVENGHIAYSRFESYQSLLGDCQEGKYR